MLVLVQGITVINVALHCKMVYGLVAMLNHVNVNA